MEKFQALVVEKEEEKVTATVKTFPQNFLPAEDVLIQVEYSSVNYKDYLATLPKGGVLRHYPLIPGIDLAGTVLASRVPEFTVGQKVIATSYQIGVSHNGGFSQLASLKKEWVVPLPSGMTTKEAMMLGTAGLTAGLAIDALLANGMQPQHRLLITGATGGVSSIASLILEKLGFTKVTLVSQKEQAPYLERLPHAEILATQKLLQSEPKVLAPQNYDYVIDAVGGEVLSRLLPQISYGGAVAAFGNAGGFKLDTTVFPFILRGVNLLGIDSVNTPYPKRQQIWQAFTEEFKIDYDKLQVETVSLADLPKVFQSFAQQTHQGRTLVAFT